LNIIPLTAIVTSLVLY